jgi:outer membrane protein OmpA-like peptidoglycan-associated protein
LSSHRGTRSNHRPTVNLPRAATVAGKIDAVVDQQPMGEPNMLRLQSTLAALCAAALLSACASSGYEPNKARDTGVGAAAGAAIGALAHSSNRTHGALAGAAVGALGGYIWSNQMEKQKREMEQATRGTGVQVTQTADNQLKLEVPSDISFDVGRADIKPNFSPILDRFAQSLNQNPAATVRIIGHTDSTGSDVINNPLSVNRAASTRDYLVGRGVASQRIAIDGRGSQQPIADNSTEAGRARNRRVEIYVGEASAG